MRVLFVCTANICRSPVAEHYLRHLAERLGSRSLVVASTGTMATSGHGADPIAQRIASERGVDLTGHKSRILDPDEIAVSDEIVVMERRHRAYLRERFPEVISKVCLLREYAGDKKDLRDPTGGTLKDYRRVFDTLFAAVEQMAFSIKYPR